MDKEDGNSNVFRIVSNEIENIFSPRKKKKEILLLSKGFETEEPTEGMYVCAVVLYEICLLYYCTVCMYCIISSYYFMLVGNY